MLIPCRAATSRQSAHGLCHGHILVWFLELVVAGREDISAPTQASMTLCRGALNADYCRSGRSKSLCTGGSRHGTATVERDHAASSTGGALGGRPRRLGRGGATQSAGGIW